MEDKVIQMPVGVFDAILGYLGQRPYSEVIKLFDEIKQSVEVVGNSDDGEGSKVAK